MKVEYKFLKNNWFQQQQRISTMYASNISHNTLIFNEKTALLGCLWSHDDTLFAA